MEQRNFLGHWKISLALLLPFLLLSSGCSSWREILPVEIKTVEVERKIPTQTRPRHVKMNDVYFYVVTADTFENFKERFGNKIINTQCFRSDSDLPPHLMNNRPRDLHRYNLGREVLIDAILLSRTNTIIGLRSNVFNSALIMGNITKERQIIIDGLGI